LKEFREKGDNNYGVVGSLKMVVVVVVEYIGIVVDWVFSQVSFCEGSQSIKMVFIFIFYFL
jgi:isoprenylcysteine carboxyl methyltransferase (ICMT) family protein YpbQ